MITKLTKNLVQFYQVIFVTVMLTTLGVMFYFWKLGIIDGSRGKNLHETSYILETLTDRPPVAAIKQIIMDENYKFALSSLKDVEKNFEKINQQVSDDSYADLVKETQQVKIAITNLLSFPKTAKVISVLNDKLEKFQTYVNANNWNTLTRSSKRIITATNGHINKEKLNILVSNLQKEFEGMEQITNNSVLSSADKAEIISRINNMNVEASMLIKYIDERKFLTDLLLNYEKSILNWVKKVNPEISLQKIQTEQVGRYYILGLIAIFVMSLLTFLSSFLANKLFLKNSQIILEKRVKKYIQENIIAAQDDEMSDFSDEFKTYTFHTAKYVNKRMSFGAIFQDTLPLASVLLDQNLKVIWANKHFSQDWKIDENEVSKEYLSWDYLAKMTNIGEDDPVLEALKNGIAGIYQVQIKISPESEVQPFEMYVSPIRYNNQNRIQLFFYPLSSLQQTINEQAMSIVGPVEKTLNLMLSNQYDEHYQNQIKRDYEIAGIIEVYEMFNALELSRRTERSTLLDELDVLHVKLEKMINTINEINNDTIAVTSGSTMQLDGLKAFKQSVIELSVAGKTFEQISNESNDLVNNLLNSFVKISQKNSGLTSFMDDCAESFPNIVDVKDDLKTQKISVSESRARLSHSISQFIHLKKKIDDKSINERFNNTLTRVQDEFKFLDAAMVQLEKRITSVEVILTKAQLLFESLKTKSQESSNNQHHELYQLFNEKLQELLQLASQFNGVIDQNEDAIVSQMGAMFIETKQNMSHLTHTSKLIAPHVIKDFEGLAPIIDANDQNVVIN